MLALDISLVDSILHLPHASIILTLLFGRLSWLASDEVRCLVHVFCYDLILFLISCSKLVNLYLVFVSLV